MRNLTKFIGELNVWRSIFNTAPITFPLSQFHVDDIAKSLDSKLSPENLHCDGEISVAEADRKYRFYAKVADELGLYCAKNSLNTPVIYEL